MSEKGRFTIPRELRSHLGVDDALDFYDDDPGGDVFPDDIEWDDLWDDA